MIIIKPTIPTKILGREKVKEVVVVKPKVETIKKVIKPKPKAKSTEKPKKVTKKK